MGDTTSDRRTGRWWITDEGRLEPARPPASRHDAFMAREWGYVRFDRCDAQATLKWDVLATSDSTLQRAMECLEDLPSHQPVCLDFFFLGWETEHFPSVDTAVCRVHEIQSFAGVSLAQTTYLKSQDLQAARQATRLVGQSLEAWDSARGELRRLDNDRIAGLAPRILIFRPNDRGEMIYSYIGPASVAAQTYGWNWAFFAVDETPEQAKGPESPTYASQINHDIRRALDSDTPAYQHVRTLVDLGNRDPYWLSYERLLARFELHDGRPGVVSVVSPTKNVDCPFLSIN